ncbi:hypothetical protein NDU88_002591 [Pleurodeles waltl]|uniref:Uncharacterized protein n=1 Tax=Pleurodeles waltl TaxID=8319 RepID=A0AAV7WQM5_PLEWA|nr:hypothetical protein NDU88_002591 [Pleurodeles waltl]
MGKANGDFIPGSRRPISAAVKPSGKTTFGADKDAKNSAGILPPHPASDVRGKDKLQPTIMCCLTGGMQENSSEHIESPPADNQSAKRKPYVNQWGEGTLRRR